MVKGDTMTERNVEAELPLTPLSFEFLLALADQERHGYGVIKEIERQTEGSMRPATGALYLAAKRLQEGGLITESENRLITESENRPEPDDDSRRKYYELTDFGRRVAAGETGRMARLVRIAVQKGLVDGLLSVAEPGS
jgi:DNA-binding PadR family transcriptional regulator